MKTLNDINMNELLDNKLLKEEKYIVKLGCSIISSNIQLINDTTLKIEYNNITSKNILSNEYAYIGITNLNNIIIVVLNTFKIDKMNCVLTIPFSSINNYTHKKSLLSKDIYTLNTNNKGSLKIQMSNNSSNNDITNQNLAVKLFNETISKIKE